MPRTASKTAPKIQPIWNADAPGLWFCNWRIAMDARRRLDKALAPLGLRAKEMYLLAMAGYGNFSQHAMADMCGLDPSTLVPMLDSLEQRGLLRRERNPEDRRVQWVRRTEAGDEAFHRALPRARRAEAQQISVLSPASQRQLINAMRKLVASSQ